MNPQAHVTDLEPSGPCNSEPLKQSKNSRSQIFYEIGSLKIFAIFKGNHLCWGLFLIKVQALRTATFLKRNYNTGVTCGYCKIFKNSFFIELLRWLLLVVLPQYSKVSWGACDFAPPHTFDFDQKLTQNVAQIIIYYHVAKQFLPCLI